MELKEFFLKQLEQETTLNRKVLERVPEGRNDWKPHSKSMALGYLAALVASMPAWVAFMIERDELNFEDPASEQFRTRAVETRAQLLELLDESFARAKRALQGTDEQHLHTRWRLVSGHRVLAEDARYVMISDAIFSHLAHHRGQLTVYLRLNEAAVPALYGPSADEGQHVG
ncbi:MAG TPA: DinB family protein [Acidobacteriaceae bacterium]